MDERIRRIVMSQPVPMRLANALVRGEHRVAMTPPRWELLKLLSSGKTRKECALAMGVSEETVKCWRRDIYSRFGVGGPRAHTKLVALLYREGII